MIARRLFALAALAALCAACRSDGGIDRADGERGMRFSTSRIAQREAESVDITRAKIAGVPASVAASFRDGWSEMAYTYRLYLEGHGEK